MPPASDPLVRPLRPLLLCAAILAAFSGCTLVGTETAEPPAPPASIDAPALTSGPTTAADDANTARLLHEAEFRLLDGDARGALDQALEVQDRYPAAMGSSRSLWLEARARRELEEWDESLSAVRRYLEIVPDTDEFADDARLLGAELRLEGGLGGGIEALFDVPESSSEDVRNRALDRARAVAASLDDPMLRQLITEAPAHGWILPVFQTELAERRALVGDSGAADRLADDAMGLDPDEREVERLDRIRRGEVEPRGDIAGTLGAILSTEGPPSLQQLSGQIRDGIEVALLEEGVRGGFQLAEADDRGTPSAAGEALRTLAARSPMGVVGPVTDGGFGEVIRSRSDRTPIISPTAVLPAQAPEGIYSLTGVDPEASRALARLALNEGFTEISILHSRASEEEAELRWFREAFESQGGRIVQLLSYAPGTSDFRNRIAEVESRAPRALVVIAPPNDLPILAAQLTLLGDDLDQDIPILGNSVWASDRTLSNLSASQTNGVLSVAPHAGQGYGPRWQRFVDSYEEHFRRTLRDPVPALGYDATLLLLEAARLGGGTTPDEVLRGMESIRDLPGATGTFSVRDGRIVRAHVPVRLQNGERVPLAP